MSTKLGTILADFTTSLSTEISVGGTTATLATATDDDGVALPSGRYFFTVDGTSTTKEHFSCDLVGTSLTNLKSLSRQGVETTGAVRKHRIGATVSLTDFGHIKFINDLIAGTTSLNSLAPLGYDGAPSALSGNQLATVAYVLGVVNGGTVTFDKQVISGQTSGEALTANDVVYFKEADAKWYKADADLTATFDKLQLGIAQSTVAINTTVQIAISGPVGGFSSLSVGSKYYLSNTAGAISTSTGTYSVFVGWALSSTILLFNPIPQTLPTQKEKEALAGGSTFGTPSSANKFITEDYLGSSSVVKFGGSGADGALTVTSGITNIDLGGAQVFVKNYSTISITGTGSITFSNPHANGTIIILKSRGNVTLTSSTAPMINASNLGSTGGTAVTQSSLGGGTSAGTTGTNGTSLMSYYRTNGGAGGTAGAGGAGGALPTYVGILFNTWQQVKTKYKDIIVGAGGGSGAAFKSSTGSQTGSATSGAGGRGGGVLIIECGGSLNFTTTSGISVKGQDGQIGSTITGTSADLYGYGGGGGGGGLFLCIYNILTANSGTVTVSGGTGANTVNIGVGGGANGGGGGASMLSTGSVGTNGTGKTGGNGGDGLSVIIANTEFF